MEHSDIRPPERGARCECRDDQLRRQVADRRQQSVERSRIQLGRGVIDDAARCAAAARRSRPRPAPGSARPRSASAARATPRPARAARRGGARRRRDAAPTRCCPLCRSRASARGQRILETLARRPSRGGNRASAVDPAAAGQTPSTYGARRVEVALPTSRRPRRPPRPSAIDQGRELSGAAPPASRRRFAGSARAVASPGLEVTQVPRGTLPSRETGGARWARLRPARACSDRSHERAAARRAAPCPLAGWPSIFFSSRPARYATPRRRVAAFGVDLAEYGEPFGCRAGRAGASGAYETTPAPEEEDRLRAGSSCRRHSARRCSFDADRGRSSDLAQAPQGRRCGLGSAAQVDLPSAARRLPRAASASRRTWRASPPGSRIRQLCCRP